jgi:predicted nucleic acid-binding protein
MNVAIDLAGLLNNVDHIFLDTVIVIYAVEKNPTYVARAEYILTKIDDGSMRASTSVVTLTEVLIQPQRKQHQALARAYLDVLTKSKNLETLPIDVLTAVKAAELRAQYNLRTPNAWQLAAAVQAGCQVFLTNDRTLQRITAIRVLVLDDLI